MTTQDDDLPTVVSEGVVNLGPVSVRVLHLSDGQRVIDADDAEKLFQFLFQEPAHDKGEPKP